MILDLQHVAKSFGEKKVLIDVSFSLEKGKISVFMGPNGSGKTTLFNILSGFLPSDNGAVILNGKTLEKKDPYQINQLGITRTFQDLRLIEELSVLENLLLAFKNQEGEKWWKVMLPNNKVLQERQSNTDKGLEILKECFIRDVAESPAREISYGQQKLLTLACCIANDADVVLLDEPVAGVNPIYREKLIDVIKNLKQKGKAILLIEHNADFIESVADEILFLNEGSIKSYKNYNELRKDEYVKEAYI